MQPKPQVPNYTPQQHENDNYQFQDFQTPFQHQTQNQPPNKQQSTTTNSYNTSYTTSITQLISQPIGQKFYSMEYVYQSIYQLSDYLWNKKIMAYYNGQNHSLDNNHDANTFVHSISFDQYLLPLQQQLTKYDKFKKSKNKQEQQIYSMLNSATSQVQHPNITPGSHIMTNNFLHKQNLNSSLLQTQLIKCYQQVPFIYFEQNFSLDFSNFQDKKNRQKYNNTLKMKQAQQVMNDNLDLIQINLFGQIHRKFQDYFKVAANFDYLKQSINLQILKLKQSRQRISKVQIQFVIKSQRLRKKIVQRTNYEKLIKKLKLLKSLRKLPSIIQTILQSSLPYECLQLLKTTKKSIDQLEHIKCVESIISNIKKCQTIVQLGLNKRYTDSVYLYIEEVFQGFNFEQHFKKIDCPVVNEKDMNTSSAIHNLNLSRRSAVSKNINGNNQTSFRADQRSGFFVLQQLGQGKGTSTFNGKPLLKNIYAKRLQQKQYQIAMIMLQSYEYIDFPIDVTKIKIMNGLRIICRKFQKDMINNFKKQLSKAQLNKSQNLLHDLSFEQVSSIITGQQISAAGHANITNHINRVKSTQHNQKDQNEDSPQKNQQYLNQVSIQFYIKHIKILNQLFKQCVNRYLGYITTLIVEYEQKITKTITEIDRSTSNNKNSNKSIQQTSQKNISSRDIQSTSNINSNSNSVDLSSSNIKILQRSEKMSKMQLSHNKFKQILVQELSLLPSIFKTIEQKTKHFLTLKNIGNASPQQFFQWISLLRFWQRWFDVFIDESPLVNYNYTYLTSTTEISSSTQLLNLGQDMMEQLVNIVVDNIKKSLNTMNLKNLITELTINYLNSYTSTVNSQLYQTLLQQSWQSVEIPQQFSEILNGILNKPTDNQNMSLTILNSSGTGKLTNQSFNSSKKQIPQNSDKSITMNNSAIMNCSSFKYKILKNNILTDGQRYKLTVSFLLLCQFIEQFIRVGRLFQGITGQSDQQTIKQNKYIKKIQSHLYDKIYQFIDHYNASTKQMILQKKALKTQKIKGNNITVKHIALLSNCLSFLQKLTRQIPLKDLMLLIHKNQRQGQTVQGLINHNILLIDKISSILNKRMESVANSLKTKQQQKGMGQGGFLQFVVQMNQSIVTVFLQITQIIDEYLDIQKCQKILKVPFLVFVQKYFKVIIEKDQKVVEQARILLEKMKFLKNDAKVIRVRNKEK